MRKELILGDLFDSLFNLGGFEKEESARTFNIEFSEDKDKYYLEADLPGIDKENINLSIKENILSITAERKYAEEKKDRKCYKLEQSYGKFVRSISIPKNADTTRVEAKFKNGVLELIIAKKEENDNIQVIEIKD